VPWKPGDAKRHTKAASSPAKRDQWSATANSVLKQTGDEARAIRIANAAVRPRGKGRR
jgi:hypothetical protein